MIYYCIRTRVHSAFFMNSCRDGGRPQRFFFVHLEYAEDGCCDKCHWLLKRSWHLDMTHFDKAFRRIRISTQITFHLFYYLTPTVYGVSICSVTWPSFSRANEFSCSPSCQIKLNLFLIENSKLFYAYLSSWSNTKIKNIWKNYKSHRFDWNIFIFLPIFFNSFLNTIYMKWKYSRKYLAPDIAIYRS